MPATTTDALLELLFWGLEKLSHPTLGTLTESFEAWEYRHKITLRLKSLARSEYISIKGKRSARTVTLTPSGRIEATGGTDAVARWRRRWDGKWRLLVFDLPISQAALRKRLWRWLRSQRFGYLQQSVWISPDPLDETLLPLRRLKLSPETVTVLEGCPTPPDRDADLVAGSWNFGPTNAAYLAVIDCCEQALAWRSKNSVSLEERQRWLVDQRSAWLKALSLDPLLPESLLPTGYLGQRALDARTMVFEQLMADLE